MKLIEPLKGPKPLANVKLEKFNTKLSCLVHIPLFKLLMIFYYRDQNGNLKHVFHHGQSLHGNNHLRRENRNPEWDQSCEMPSTGEKEPADTLPSCTVVLLIMMRVGNGWTLIIILLLSHTIIDIISHFIVFIMYFHSDNCYSYIQFLSINSRLQHSLQWAHKYPSLTFWKLGNFWTLCGPW